MSFQIAAQLLDGKSQVVQNFGLFFALPSVLLASLLQIDYLTVDFVYLIGEPIKQRNGCSNTYQNETDEGCCYFFRHILKTK